MHTLEAKNLVKTFTISERQRRAQDLSDRKKIAVNDISFTAHSGEVFGLLGPNGAGKTTTMRMLSTLIRPDSGDVFYDGVNKTIGRNRVAVPDALFKVVLCTKNYARAIGFVVPNQGRHRDIRSYVTSIDDIEQMTGINFFPKLKPDTERRVEAAEQDDMVSDWGVKARYYHNFDN